MCTRGAIQAGFMTVTALVGHQLDSERNRYERTLDPDFDAADYLLEYDTIHGALWKSAEEAWINTPSGSPKARYATPQQEAYLLPLALGGCTISFSNGYLINEASGD